MTYTKDEVNEMMIKEVVSVFQSYGATPAQIVSGGMSVACIALSDQGHTKGAAISLVSRCWDMLDGVEAND